MNCEQNYTKFEMGKDEKPDLQNVKSYAQLSMMLA